MLTIQEAKEAGWSNERAPLFVAWLRNVNARVEMRLGVGIDDLPDWNFADAFEDDMRPYDAAELFLECIAEDFGFPF